MYHDIIAFQVLLAYRTITLKQVFIYLGVLERLMLLSF